MFVKILNLKIKMMSKRSELLWRSLIKLQEENSSLHIQNHTYSTINGEQKTTKLGYWTNIISKIELFDEKWTNCTF